MKILIDIGHPAHVHYFKNFAKHFIKRGSKVLFIAREKDVVIDLLNRYKFNYIVVFRKYRLFSIQFIDKGGFNSTGKKHVTFPIIHFQMSRNLAYPDTPTSPIHFLSKDELKNWKRTILIDDMLK